MKKEFLQYYRENGVRYPGDLIRLTNFQLNQFSRGAVLHVYDDGDGHYDIDVSKPYFQGYQKRIVTEIISDYALKEGSLRPVTGSLNDAMSPWRRKNAKMFQVEHDLSVFKLGSDQLAVVNYGYLDFSYKYMPNISMPYYHWKNTYWTVFSHMDALAESMQRQQYIFIQLPKALQGVTVLTRYQDRAYTQTMMEIFGKPTTDGFMQLDIWRWLNPETRRFSILNVIRKKNFDKINLVFQGSTGKQVLVNLGFLNSWIKGQENQTFMSSVTQVSALNLQKLFLKMALTLNDIEVVEGQEALEVIEGQPSAPAQENENIAEVTLPSDDVSDALGEQHDELADMYRKLSKLKADEKHTVPTKQKEVADKDDKHVKELIHDIEDDLKALDLVSLAQVKNKGVKINEEATAVAAPVSNTAEPPEPPEDEVEPMTKEEIDSYLYRKAPSEQVVMSKLAEAAEANLITASEYRKMHERIQAFENSEDPYGSGLPRKKASQISQDEIKIKKEDKELIVGANVPDKSMAEASLLGYNRKYKKELYQKDVLNAISKIQSQGVVIQSHEVSRKTTVLGTYEYHRLDLKPIDGKPSIVTFPIPVFDEEGNMMVNSTKYSMRKQRVDLPIRKIAPDVVSISSYSGKTSVQTSQKVVNSTSAWIVRQINLAMISDSELITEVSLGNVFDNEYIAPYMYNMLASEFESFRVKGNLIFFNHQVKDQYLDAARIQSLEKDGNVFCGLSVKKNPIVIDMNDQFFEVTPVAKIPLGDIFQFLQLPQDKAPINFTEVRVFSKYIPVGLVLGYYSGFKKLLQVTRAKYRIVPARKMKNLQPGEVCVSFKDKSYIFEARQPEASMLFSGFADYEKTLKLYDSELFEHKDVYLNLFISKGLSSLYVRELDQMEYGFIDPITEETLIEMNEPTTFEGLLYRANNMLLTYHHPATQDREVMRDRGYERFAGTIYKELTAAIRNYRSKNLFGRSKIELPPYQIWNTIMKDPTIKIVEDINPVQNVKESEVFTYSGAGGRSKDTMTKPSRAAHISDFGLTSESTVDNAGVGTVAYLSANPNIDNLRGMIKKDKTITPTSVMSTAALLSPYSFTDNPKRIMFITTQHGHTIASSGYKQPYVRTGYEKVIPKRTGKMFATAALEDGVVVSVADKGMVIKYASGDTESIPLGRQYGRAEGSYYPHDLITRLKAGTKFKKGDIIAYNEKFFEPDFLSPTDVNLKISTYATVAFIEDKSTHEDSCTVGPSLSSVLETEVPKVKSYVVRFTQNIRDLVKIGTMVEPKDVLMIIEDDIISTSDQYSSGSLDALKKLSNMAPKAGLKGIVEKIEVFYNGDKADMTDSLKKISNKNDNDLADQSSALNQDKVTGRVSTDYRVSGKPLEPNTAEIRIYITAKNITGSGDKVVFGHQMKSTIAEVHSAEIYSETGERIDAIFSYRSLAAREVNSTNMVGTTAVLLDLAAQRAIQLYEKGSLKNE